MKEVPEHNQLFALVDANARTGRRGGDGESLAVRSVKFSVPTAEIRSTKNGGRLLSFFANHGLALFNTFFGTAKTATSIKNTFNGRGKIRS